MPLYNISVSAWYNISVSACMDVLLLLSSSCIDVLLFKLKVQIPNLILNAQKLFYLTVLGEMHNQQQT